MIVTTVEIYCKALPRFQFCIFSDRAQFCQRWEHFRGRIVRILRIVPRVDCKELEIQFVLKLNFPVGFKWEHLIQWHCSASQMYELGGKFPFSPSLPKQWKIWRNQWENKFNLNFKIVSLFFFKDFRNYLRNLVQLSGKQLFFIGLSQKKNICWQKI